jgi:hypothetical protein
LGTAQEREIYDQYNQLRNLGFAITPIVEMGADVKTLGPNGQTIQDRSYESGEVNGTNCTLNLHPEEEIAKTTHRAAYELMDDAAVEAVRDAGPASPVANLAMLGT